MPSVQVYLLSAVVPVNRPCDGGRPTAVEPGGCEGPVGLFGLFGSGGGPPSVDGTLVSPPPPPSGCSAMPCAFASVSMRPISLLALVCRSGVGLFFSTALHAVIASPNLPSWNSDVQRLKKYLGSGTRATA